MTKTRKVSPARHGIYLKKAAEFERAMTDAAAREDWNAVGLNAVHTVISAGDAITTFFLGERSAGSSHGDIVRLLQQVPVNDARTKAQQAFEVIQEKNVVEYEDVAFDAVRSERVAKQARRFHEWVKAALGAA